jgi:hypothetical protein
MKATADRDLSIVAEPRGRRTGGGLVNEISLFLTPFIVGGGTRALPDGLRVDLELVDERRFDNGFVYLRHDVKS